MVIRDAAEAQHVRGERMVAGGDWLAELLLDPLDDARHVQAGAGNEDGVALGGGADVENGLLDGLRGDAGDGVVIRLVEGEDRKSTRLNSSHSCASRMTSLACKKKKKKTQEK